MYDIVNSFAVPLNTLEDVYIAFPDEDSCIKYLEQFRWNGKPYSPFSIQSKIYYCSKGKYKCKNTKKYFTVKTNTIFDGTKIPLQTWFVAIIVYLTFETDFKSSQYYLQSHLNINPRSVWLLLYKIQYTYTHLNYKIYTTKLKTYLYFEFILQGLMTVPRKVVNKNINQYN